MKYTHLIWDFNGTVYNDVDAGIASANRLLCSHGLSPIASKEQYRAVFGFPIIDYYRRLGFDFERVSYAEVAQEWVPYYMEASRDAMVYPDILEALSQAKHLGLAQMILSATELTMLRGQIEGLGIAHCFDEILGMDNIQAHSKESVARAWRDRNPDAVVLMIGDTDHDAAVASAMGADCILLTCGHQCRATLEKCTCLAVVDSATEAMEYLEKE